MRHTVAANARSSGPQDLRIKVYAACSVLAPKASALQGPCCRHGGHKTATLATSALPSQPAAVVALLHGGRRLGQPHLPASWRAADDGLLERLQIISRDRVVVTHPIRIETVTWRHRAVRRGCASGILSCRTIWTVDALNTVWSVSALWAGQHRHCCIIDNHWHVPRFSKAACGLSQCRCACGRQPCRTGCTRGYPVDSSLECPFGAWQRLHVLRQHSAAAAFTTTASMEFKVSHW